MEIVAIEDGSRSYPCVDVYWEKRDTPKGRADYLIVALEGGETLRIKYSQKPECAWEAFKSVAAASGIIINGDPKKTFVGKTVLVKRHKISYYNGQYSEDRNLVVGVREPGPEDPAKVEATEKNEEDIVTAALTNIENKHHIKAGYLIGDVRAEIVRIGGGADEGDWVEKAIARLMSSGDVYEPSICRVKLVSVADSVPAVPSLPAPAADSEQTAQAEPEAGDDRAVPETNKIVLVDLKMEDYERYVASLLHQHSTTSKNKPAKLWSRYLTKPIRREADKTDWSKAEFYSGVLQSSGKITIDPSAKDFWIGEGWVTEDNGQWPEARFKKVP